MSRAFPTPNKSKVRSAQFFSLIEPSQSLSNYNNSSIIIWITTFKTAFFITRSCYLRLTLYGYRETPFSNHFKTCNPKSIKPTDYKQSNIINADYKYANKKRAWTRLIEIQALDKQKLSRSPSSINYKYSYTL